MDNKIIISKSKLIKSLNFSESNRLILGTSGEGQPIHWKREMIMDEYANIGAAKISDNDKWIVINSDSNCERNVGWRANYRRTFEACRGKYVAYCDGDDWWSDSRKLQMQADLLESDPSCGMCYTRASNYYQNTGLTEPDHEEHFTDFDRLLCRLTIANCATLARRDLIARYYAEVRPDEHPEWLTDDAPMWLWFAACSRVRYLPAITAVHRRLPQSVSHSTEYPRRIAFCDSLMDISLWFDARYGARRNRFRILRRRSSVALWVLSWNGSVGEYLARWRCDVAACPRLLFCPEGCGLLVKKILFRRKKQRL